MSFKDDPLDQNRRPSTTLWLNRENMERARENYWQAAAPLFGVDPDAPESPVVISPQAVWRIAWAAAVAAQSYIMEGRVEPR